MKSKFLVFKLPRTGSSMFGKVLNAHGEVSCKNEFLNSVNHKTVEEKIKYFADFFSQENTKNKQGKDIQALGATLNPFKYNLKVSDLTKNLNIPQFKMILLIRRNFLLQARSFYIVKETTNGLRFQLNKDDKRKLKAISFDFEKLQNITQRFERKSQRLKTYVEKLSNNNFMMLYYEDLLEDRQRRFNELFEYIEVSQPSPDFDYSGGREKIISDDWTTICKNFDEINNYPYLKQFL